MLEFGILLQNQKLINLIAIASHVVFATKFRNFVGEFNF